MIVWSRSWSRSLKLAQMSTVIIMILSAERRAPARISSQLFSLQ